MKLAPYPEYKDSGTPWLGKIPVQWNIYRNGRLFAQRNETGRGDLPILEVSLKTGVRVRDMDNLKRKQVMSDREKYKWAAQGDIAYNMMRMWQGAVGVAPVDGLVSPAYVVIRPFPGVDCRYYSYLFRTSAYMNEIDGYSRGIVKDRNRLYWQDFKRMPSILPPLAEQQLIASFLDAIGSKVQRFINNKQQLIELLKEQKQNTINQAVTRGINPDVKLKPSGVEWLGDIPEHWKLERIKYLFKEFNGRKKNDDYMLLSFSRHKGLIPYSEINTRPPSAIDLSKYKVCRVGHLIMNRMQAWSGMFTAVDIEGIVSPDYSVFESKTKVEVNYYSLLFKTKRYIQQFAMKSKGVGDGFNRLYTPDFGAIPAPHPTVDEQLEIVSFVSSNTKMIDSAISRAEHEIDLIREYRTRLIFDVVTGKVDARGIEVPEVAEEELLVLDEDAAKTDNVIDDEAALEVAE